VSGSDRRQSRELDHKVERTSNTNLPPNRLDDAKDRTWTGGRTDPQTTPFVLYANQDRFHSHAPYYRKRAVGAPCGAICVHWFRSRPDILGAGRHGQFLGFSTASLFLGVINIILTQSCTTAVHRTDSVWNTHRYEVKCGCFNPLVSFVATQVVSLFHACISASCVAAPVFLLAGFPLNAAQFGVFWVSLLLCGVFGGLLGCCLRSIRNTANEALLLLLPVCVILYLFGGFLIPYSTMHESVRWLYDCNFVQYISGQMRVNHYASVSFTDCDVDMNGCWPTGAAYLEKINYNKDDNFVIPIVICIVVLATCTAAAHSRALTRTDTRTQDMDD